jgi:hypothetical protein
MLFRSGLQDLGIDSYEPWRPAGSQGGPGSTEGLKGGWKELIVLSVFA